MRVGVVDSNARMRLFFLAFTVESVYLVVRFGLPIKPKLKPINELHKSRKRNPNKLTIRCGSVWFGLWLKSAQPELGQANAEISGM